MFIHNFPPNKHLNHIVFENTVQTSLLILVPEPVKVGEFCFLELRKLGTNHTKGTYVPEGLLYSTSIWS